MNLFRYGDMLINPDHVVKVTYITLPAPVLTVTTSDGSSYPLRGDEAERTWKELGHRVPAEPGAADQITAFGRALFGCPY